MPMFRKKSVNKKLLQEKLRIAEEKPDSVFDLSECGLQKVHEGIYSKCKILNKQALLLQHNLLEDLKGGGNLEDLSKLLVLDLSHNRLKVLPKEIKCLVNLQRFDISHNKIKKLPDEIGSLKALEKFDCSNNDLSGLPGTIKYFKNLTTLNITENRFITSLPVNLCFCKKLKEFIFDVDRITYPSKQFTSQGIEEIQRFFKKMKGEEYFSQDLLDAPKSPTRSVCTTPDDDFEESIKKREELKLKEQEKRLQIEREILEGQEDTAKLVANAEQQRHKFHVDLEKSNLQAQTELAEQFNHENQQRNKLLEELYLGEESHFNETVNLLVSMAERRKHTDQILEELEQEQERIDALVRITSEETERLRKQEMIEAMAYVLKEMELNKAKWEEYENRKKETMVKSICRDVQDQEDLEKVLKEKDEDQSRLLQTVITEEEKQRAAFEMLQFQKDSRLNRIKKEVKIIETELARLSLLERQKREEKHDDEVNTLAEMRLQTAILLSQLIDEQEKREQRLKSTIHKMEEERDDQTKDFWLIQFQRLVDNKPQLLIDDENKLDMYVVEILLHASAREYLPHFARHHVTEMEMNQMTRDRLKEIGVHNEEMISNILSNIDSTKSIKTKFVEKETEIFSPQKEVVEDPLANATPSHVPKMIAPPALDVCSESECVICLEEQPSVVFLTCGHVCCCATCCQPLDICPLCRQPITQKCRLYRSM
ncbi:E3 ubiquitin-protein ligase LRSAM1-like isoform X2 [Clytia hemisphaerica]